jgi:uncharacterized protein
MIHAAIPSTIAPHLRLITERIVQQFQPLKIILFGSYARGDATTDSDLDLLIVMPSGTHKRQQAIAIGQALADVPISKDIIVTTPEEIATYGQLVGTILRPALREGTTLYERATS